VDKKEHVLDERDSLLVEMRHKHFAAASLRISALLDEFRARNAKVAGAKGRGADLELRNMSKLIQSLPQYRWARQRRREECVCVWPCCC
jgi:syntaxin-binding protein 1